MHLGALESASRVVYIEVEEREAPQHTRYTIYDTLHPHSFMNGGWELSIMDVTGRALGSLLSIPPATDTSLLFPCITVVILVRFIVRGNTNL